MEVYVDDYVCLCGNTADGLGFDPCNVQGEFVEPLPGWCGLYKCVDCGILTTVEDGKVYVINDSLGW